MPRSRRPALAVVVSLAVGAGLLVAPAVAASVTPPTAATAASTASAAPAPARAYVERDGLSAPVYSYRDAIRESVYVLAQDADGDGQPDRVAVDVVRPAELDGTDRLSPVVMDASPYYSCCGRGNESELKTYDADGDPRLVPLFYDNYFVPRGYASVSVDMAGTNRSTGCVDEGGVSDVGSVEAVVDWLNGRAEAVDASGAPVVADWTDGKVGMIGKSYDGTLANGVASTGVEGLETIVPIAGISSWYDYTRLGGLPTSAHYASWLSRYVQGNRSEDVDCAATLAGLDADDADATGDRTDFWADRDYRIGAPTAASKVTASVLITHGLQDTNVKTPNFSRWWHQLGQAGVTRKMFLTRLGHVDPFDSEREVWVDLLHRWFDHELMGIDNGVTDEPAVSVEVRPDVFVDSDTWPVRSGRTVLRPRADGTLSAQGFGRGRTAFVNAPRQSEAQAVSTDPNESRALWVSDPLARTTRISGVAKVDLTVTSETETGQVGIALVDYGEASRVLASGDGATTLETKSCYGKATTYDDGCYFEVARAVGTTPLQVLARGWARLDGDGTRTIRVPLAADDSRVLAGHRLGLVITGSTQWTRSVDTEASRYVVDGAGTQLVLPAAVTFAPAAEDARSLRALAPLASLPDGTVPTPAQARSALRH